MKKLLFALATVIATQTACVTTLDKLAMTSISVSDDGQTFMIAETWSDTQKTSDDLFNRWVNEYVADNNLCARAGFEQVSVRDIVVNKTSFGITIYRREHRYKCKN